MTDDEFDLYLEMTVAELEAKQEQLTNLYGMGTHHRWVFQDKKGLLQFFDADSHLQLQAEVLVIGSFLPEPSAWKWGWANELVLDKIKSQSLPLQELAQITQAELFMNADAFEIEAGMEWELTAMAVAHMNLLGCYRAQDSDGKRQLFLGIKTVSPL
jgi:hypothetical protein